MNFMRSFCISVNDVMESVYNLPFPNRFLGTIAYFLGDYMDNEYVYNPLTNNLRSFFNRNVCQYDYINYPIRFVGSLALCVSRYFTRSSTGIRSRDRCYRRDTYEWFNRVSLHEHRRVLKARTISKKIFLNLKNHQLIKCISQIIL